MPSPQWPVRLVTEGIKGSRHSAQLPLLQMLRPRHPRGLTTPTSEALAGSGEGTCTSNAVGLLVRRHILAGEFHYIGKEASTRWASGPDPSMLADAGALDPADETCREYERVVDPKYLDQIRTEAKQFSTKLLSRQSSIAECAIRKFKNGKNTIKPRTLRKLTRGIHELQNNQTKN